MSSSPTRGAAHATAAATAGGARRDTHATRTALIAAAVAFVVVVGADRWTAQRVEARARAEVRAEMLPRVDALRSAAIRGVSLLSALVSFTDSRRDRAQFDAEFPTFAQGVFAERGLRALQFIERGRIVVVWPMPGNEAAYGFDLSQHPDPRVRADLSTSLTSAAVTFTGPVQLVQGGLGVLVRQRLSTRPGFPELASVVLDVAGLLTAAGIPDTSGRLALEVIDNDGRWIAGSREGSAVAPETLAVGTGASVIVLAAPSSGWNAAMGPARRAVRGALALVVLAAALVGWLIGRRRDRLEGEMRRSSTALRLVMSANRMGGWEEEVRSRRVRWNPTMEEMLAGARVGPGAGVERLLGALESADAARLRASMERARAGTAEEFLEEVRLRVAGGEARWMLALGGLVRDADARPARLVGVLADASEQRELEERVRHSQRLEALAKLAGGVAHDFNNLLGAIVGYTEFARTRAMELPAADAELLRGDLDQLVANAERGARLTEQLSTFSRRAGADREPLDVSTAVAELAPTLERLLVDRARLTCELAPALPRVLLDAEQFTQVLMNLVVNARDAMPQRGTIVVRTSLVAEAALRPADVPAGRWVCLEVQDEGVGISREVRERMFEPYFTTKPMGSGTGLGLSVVHGIVDASGGRVAVRSTEGDGTTFLILLPPHEGRAA